jgi:hypothetical protein
MAWPRKKTIILLGEASCGIHKLSNWIEFPISAGAQSRQFCISQAWRFAFCECECELRSLIAGLGGKARA